METSYRIAGIDVHKKKMLAVVITDAAREGAFQFQRRKFLTLPSELERLREWLLAENVQEVVMESTAQYWKPVWQELEGRFRLELAQAQSNRAPRGRKRDFVDAERLVRRQIAGELVLSFVPGSEQRLWRILTRSRQQLKRDKVRLQNQREGLLEEARIKRSSQLSDLLGASGRRMLKALAEGQTDAAHLATMADRRVRATGEQLADALSRAGTVNESYRRLLGLYLERLEVIERQMEELNQRIAVALRPPADAVARLAEVNGLGVDSAQQIIAEVGPEAAAFPSAGQLCSWVGTCPGREESAEESKSNHSPKGNRSIRRVLSQAANAAVKTQGSAWQALYQRLAAKRGHNRAIWAIANHMCRAIWKILHHGVRFEERGIRPNPQAVHKRANKLLGQLRALGYKVQMAAP
jgi:transposase